MSRKNRELVDTNTHSRRRFITTGAALVGLAVTGTTPTGAQSENYDESLRITIYPEEEFIVIVNTGEREVDLTGYSINFDAEGGNDQIRQLAGEVVIPDDIADEIPGEERRIVVPTGAREVDQSPIVELQEPYNGEVLANDGSDVIALLDPQGNLVASSEGPPENGGGSDEPSSATGLVRVVDQNGGPVEGEPVRFEGVVYEGQVEELTTNEEGVARLELMSSDPSDVVAYDVTVRDQTQELLIEHDGEHGVSEIVFEVDSSDDVGDSGDENDGDDGSDDDSQTDDGSDSDDVGHSGDGDDGSDDPQTDDGRASGGNETGGTTGDEDVADEGDDGAQTTDGGDSDNGDDCPKR